MRILHIAETLEGASGVATFVRELDVISFSRKEKRTKDRRIAPALSFSRRRDRRLTGPTMPPQGLYMNRVGYDGPAGEMMADELTSADACFFGENDAF